MQKVRTCLLVMILCLLLSACSVLNPASLFNSPTQSGGDATRSDTVATTTTTAATVATTTTKADVHPQGGWVKEYFVDEFDEPTSSWYITTDDLCSGTFSNSATTNSKLLVRFIIMEDTIALRLWEYGSHEVKNSGSRLDTYEVVIKDQNGTKRSMSAVMPSKGNYLFIDTQWEETVKNIFLQGGTITFYLEYNEIGMSTYRFSVDTTGFRNAWEAR